MTNKLLWTNDDRMLPFKRSCSSYGFITHQLSLVIYLLIHTLKIRIIVSKWPLIMMFIDYNVSCCPRRRKALILKNMKFLRKSHSCEVLAFSLYTVFISCMFLSLFCKFSLPSHGLDAYSNSGRLRDTKV